MGFAEEFSKEINDTENEIKKILPQKPAEVYGIFEEFISRGGKRVRPILTLVFTKAYGGNYREALRPAALIEIFHNFTLVHDDIEDNSPLRRGKPTLHRLHGVAIALNSGDAIYTAVWNEILKLKNEEVKRVLGEAFRRVVEGQGRELYWERNKIFDLGEREYMEMASGKTGALIGAACEIGAVVAKKSKKEREAARTFGENIGLAFQIQDDILNLTGEVEKYKKKIGDDITEGKRTLMVIKTLERANPEDKKRLVEILSSHTEDEMEIREAIGIIKRYGGVEYAKKKAEKLVEEGVSKIEKALPENKEKQRILKIARYFTSRNE
ncbi:MAG: polyprenyl synthetase family protein [Candidatus Anstonellales archaeon]